MTIEFRVLATQRVLAVLRGEVVNMNCSAIAYGSSTYRVSVCRQSFARMTRCWNSAVGSLLKRISTHGSLSPADKLSPPGNVPSFYVPLTHSSPR